MDKHTSLNTVTITGVGDVNYGDLFHNKPSKPRDPYDLAIKATKNALIDSGLDRDDIDGVICVRDIEYEPFCHKLGIEKPKLVNYLLGEGRQSGMALDYAAMAVQNGDVENVLIIYSNIGGSGGANYGSKGEGSDPYGFVHGMTSLGAQSAAMVNRYMHDYNVTSEPLANIAISNRYHASFNSNSVFTKKLTYEDYYNSRYIVEPLQIFDYCLINDGAVAIIVSNLKVAKNTRKPIVEIIASSARGDMGATYLKKDFFYESCRLAAEEIYSKAGLNNDDIDCLQIYDNFTPTVLFGLEGFGFCEKGEAADYIKEIGISVGKSKRPINTSGSHTSESYMQGFNLLVEAVRQVRNECGLRQVKDCNIAQYICPSPIVSSHIFAKR